MRRPRVALLFDTFPPHRDGGAGFVHNLSRELVRFGGEVHVITSTTAASFDVGTMPSGFHLWPILDRWTWGRHDWRAATALRRKLTSIEPDVVHVIYPSSERPNGYHLPMLLKFIARCPVVVTFFALSLLRGVSLRTRLTSLSLILTSDVLVSHDPGYLSFLRLLSSWRLGRVRFVPVGANVQMGETVWDPAKMGEYRAALGLPPADFYVSHFGAVDASRDLDTLFEAVRRLQSEGLDVRLLMIGGRSPITDSTAVGFHTEFRRRLAQMASSLGDAVIWTGFCSDEKVTEYFLATDCTALLFHRNTLGRSSLAAALSLGMPVMTTAPGRRALFLRHCENAMLVPKDRPGRVAAALREMLESPDLRHRLSLGARDAARWYEWENVTRRAIATYREAGVRWPVAGVE